MPPGQFALVIPAFNEAATIGPLVEAVLQQVDTVFVVDDGSLDGTADQLAHLPVTLIRHEHNLGKAASLRDGMQAALALGFEGILTLDGDGQHDPTEIPRLLDAARRNPRMLVIGSRLWNVDIIPKARYRANRFANFWIAWASGQAIEDSQSGFRVYPAQLLHTCRVQIHPRCGFVFESEIIIEAAWRGFPCLFVPVGTVYPENARPSHFRPIADIARITRMVAGRLLCRALFLPGLWRSLTQSPRRADMPLNPP